MNTAANLDDWVLASLLAVLVSLAWHLDAPQQQASAAAEDAQRHAQAEARRERAAAQLCTKLRGPGTAHGWTPDGALVCTRRGPARTASSTGA